MRPRLLHALLVLVTLLLAACQSGCGASLSQPELGAEAAAQLKAFPFETWDTLTRTHVDDKGRADYTALKADPSQLRSFVGTLSTVGPGAYPDLFPTPDHKFAYFINGYNALAMFNALSRYPGLTNLDDIKVDFFYLTEVRISGQTINLYDLENEIVRPRMREHYVGKGEGSKLGRVHFALNCASASCPQLPDEAFMPATLEAQLDAETRKFVTEARNVTVDDAARKVTLSRIFDWYKEDFTDDAGKPINQLAWINKYRAEDQQLDTSYAIEFFEYDWTLNDQKLYE